MKKNFRKRRALAEEEEEGEEEKKDSRLSSSLEEIKQIQKQRERTKGIAAGLLTSAGPDGNEAAAGEGGEEGDGGELVLHDTFAQESEIAVEDPNMLKYVEQELAKRRGQQLETANGTAEEKRAADEGALYSIPEHLQVKKVEGDEVGTAWTTGIAEVQLPIEYKLRNIEETEQAKRALAERRPFYSKSRQPTSTLPASFSADFYQRGRDHAEKMRQENSDMYRTAGRGGGARRDGAGGAVGIPFVAGGGEQQGGEGRRQTATDDIMLDRFRKRERTRMMRR